MKLLFILKKILCYVRPKTFYLIDDDPDEPYLFEAALKDLLIEATLVWQREAEDALTELASHTTIPDYIFIDINMPLIGGWDCLEKIRQLRHLDHVPIAMYSTSATKSMHENPDRTGYSACIDKTPSIPQLVDALTDFIKKY